MVSFSTTAITSLAILSGALAQAPIPCTSNFRSYCGWEIIRGPDDIAKFRDLVFTETAKRPTEGQVYDMLYTCLGDMTLSLQAPALCGGGQCVAALAYDGSNNGFCRGGAIGWPA
ncbi:hypothetical protein B0H67DRAFT_681120 [Lasiosphaeris hirsuta]|uniref:Uncharacterized protein n=1 Tax=Lasiosphaeris hirsuta TaxID=260670 RepID=A0AA40E2S7_9PEZI|nr:hypothetical protein B0H67DRAFT_681120 [Lasiosphaeris hirsuta]